MDIMGTVFTLNESEKLIISNSIDFLCANKMIKKYNGLRKYGSMLGSYLKSKLWNKYLTINSFISQIVQMKFQNFIYQLLVVKIGLNPMLVGVILIIL